jgi:alpha-glucosidase
MLALYRRLLVARRASPALHAGDLQLADPVDGLVAFERHEGDDVRLVVVNFTDQEADASGVATELVDLVVEVSTHREHEGSTFAGLLAPDEAVVLRPRVG